MFFRHLSAAYAVAFEAALIYKGGSKIALRALERAACRGIFERLLRLAASLHVIHIVLDALCAVLLKMEDNYAQINCISTFVWCTLLGLLFSAILARTTSGNRSVFTPEEMKQNQDDEFNF